LVEYTTKVSFDLTINDVILLGTGSDAGRVSEVRITRIKDDKRMGCGYARATTVDEVEVPHREVGPTIRIQNSEFRMMRSTSAF
jgi:hypothetical protein